MDSQVRRGSFIIILFLVFSCIAKKQSLTEVVFSTKIFPYGDSLSRKTLIDNEYKSYTTIRVETEYKKVKMCIPSVSLLSHSKKLILKCSQYRIPLNRYDDIQFPSYLLHDDRVHEILIEVEYILSKEKIQNKELRFILEPYSSNI